MNPSAPAPVTTRTVMLIAGEPSGDMLAAELVTALRAQGGERGLNLRFLGAGGEHMTRAGVTCSFDLTRHSVIGITDVLRLYFQFRRLLARLVDLALEQRPDVIVCVDFSGFNRRFAHRLRRRAAGTGWQPRIIQYVSPQVWASRPGRARKIARDYDLLLAIFPFEPAWYAQRVPGFRVEFVGHPMVDRHRAEAAGQTAGESVAATAPEILLLPGSRPGELRRHLPVLMETVQRIAQARPTARFRMVLPGENLRALAAGLVNIPPQVAVQVGGLAAAMRAATVAIASTGTVTMECALFGVPTVALYRTSWGTYQIARRIVRVPFIAMPNVLANQAVMPEFIQHAATAENLAGAALELLADPARRAALREELSRIVASLGKPGAPQRAARLVLDFL